MPSNFLRIDSAHLPSRKKPEGLSGSPRLTPVSLEILRGKAKQLVREVHSPVFLIGSASDCDLVLGDKSFPDAYAYLYLSTSGISIRHLGEGPQLLVNDHPVDASQLQIGDRLEMGIYEFRLAEVPAPKQPTSDGDHQPTSVSRSESKTTAAKTSSAKVSTAGQVSAITQVRELMLDIRREMAAKHATLRLYLGPNVESPAETAKPLPRPLTAQLRASA